MMVPKHSSELLVIAAVALIVVGFVGPVAAWERSQMAVQGVLGEKPEPSMENYRTVQSIELVDGNTLRIRFGEHVVLERAGTDDRTVTEIRLQQLEPDYGRVTTKDRPDGTRSIDIHIDETPVPGTYLLELRHVAEDAGGAWAPGDQVTSQSLEFRITGNGEVIVTEVPDGAIYSP